MNKVNARWVQLEVFILKRNEILGVSIALNNRQCKNDVPKCPVPLCHPSFICILLSQHTFNIFDFSRSCKGGVHLSPCIILIVSDKMHLSYGSSPETF